MLDRKHHQRVPPSRSSAPHLIWCGDRAEQQRPAHRSGPHRPGDRLCAGFHSADESSFISLLAQSLRPESWWWPPMIRVPYPGGQTFMDMLQGGPKALPFQKSLQAPGCISLCLTFTVNKRSHGWETVPDDPFLKPVIQQKGSPPVFSVRIT